MSRRSAWVPWGSLVFLVVAALLVTALIVARPSWFGGDPPADRRLDTTLLDIGETDGVRLSDDNGNSSTFTLPVPVDSPVDDPVLRLRGHTEVAGSSTVFLRVQADGQNVHVSELPSGNHQLNEDIDLTRSMVEDGEVRVQVRTTGTLDQQRCNLTTDLGALVVLDAEETRLTGELEDRLHTVRDVVAGLDQKVTLVLAPRANDKEWYQTTAQLGAFLTEQGHDVHFADKVPDEDDGSAIMLGPDDILQDQDWDPLTEEGSVRVGERGDQTVLGIVSPNDDVVPTFLTTTPVTTADSDSSDPTKLQVDRPSGDRATLERLGVDTSVQQIIDRRSWRVPYSLADLPGGTVAKTLALQMLVPETTEDARWLVQVRLNDELVGSKVLTEAGRQNVYTALPPDKQLVRNDLVVTLIRDRDLGGCHVRQTSYDVQVLPDSALVVGEPGAGFTAVPAQFASGFDVLVDPSALEDSPKSLAGLVPTLAEFSGWRQGVSFVWEGEPGTRPFLQYGEPQGVSAPVQVGDGRISAEGFDLSSFSDGLVVQCVTAGSTPGLVVTPVGDPGTVVPPYGRERARLVTAGGGGFTVTADGQVILVPEARAENEE